MARFLAGAAACFLLLTGAFLLWQGRAEEAALPSAPKPRLAAIPGRRCCRRSPQAPEADAKSREEKRFAAPTRTRTAGSALDELLEPRRKAFAKLDNNGNGTLSFEEWAVKTIDKFEGADKDRSGWLTPAEYATTAPSRARNRPVAAEYLLPLAGGVRGSECR